MSNLFISFVAAASLLLAPASMSREPHPHIRAALLELEAAKLELKTAAHDFGGHRVAAMRALDGAINQLKIAQQYDK